jgi:hypothetical protein
MLLAGSLHAREGTEYAVDPATGCWNWLKGKTERGYAWGHAHRHYWAAVNGPVPEGHHVHHKCENPSCVNPDHLEPLDSSTHLKQHKRADSPVTEEQVLELRRRVSEGERLPDIAKDMGLVYWTAWNISVGQNWADVAGPRTLPAANCAFKACSKPLPDDRRPNRVYCDRDCRVRAWREREGFEVRPHLWKAA